MAACPVCGDALMLTVNSWEPSSGVYRHEHHHADAPERERRGLVNRVCSSAEPMSIARLELADRLVEAVRAGAVSMAQIAECAADIRAMVYREVNA